MIVIISISQTAIHQIQAFMPAEKEQFLKIITNKILHGNTVKMMNIDAKLIGSVLLFKLRFGIAEE